MGTVISHSDSSAFISPTLAGSVPLSCVLYRYLRTERSLSTGAKAQPLRAGCQTMLSAWPPYY